VVTKRGYVQIIDHKNYNPRLIEYLTDSGWIGDIPPAEYLALFLRKLENPVEIWGHAFRNQLSPRARHLLFILTTMPTESRIGDVGQAFVSLHNSQCAKFGIAHSATDFNSALKELDGTFAGTRKVQEFVLVRFQNPSIRDFMQYLLLSGELLPEVIASLVFFEQAQWFVETLREEKPQVPSDELARHIPQIVGALKTLVDANSCSISVEGQQQWARITAKMANPAARLATIASAFANQKDRNDVGWMETKISELVAGLEAGKISPSSVVRSIEPLKALGYLDSDAGKYLVVVLKDQAMSEPCGLDDFETLANVIKTVPQSFGEAELKTVRAAYSKFADQYATECDFTNPDELRDEAYRIGDVGDLLRVDTDAAQETLRASADEIEKRERSDRDDDDDRRGGGDVSDECSDGELDSMFGTLGS
jgi:hypothetical protein